MKITFGGHFENALNYPKVRRSGLLQFFSNREC